MKFSISSLLVTVIAFSFSAKAQFDGGIEDLPVTKVIGTANGGTILLGPTAAVENIFQPGNEQSKKIKNIIRFSLFEETTKYLSADFTVTVQVRIQYGPNSSSLNTLDRDFTVSYSKAEGTKYNAKNYLSFEGAEFVRVTIMGGPNPPSAGGVTLSDILLVENEMRVTRYYELQPGVTPAFSPLIPSLVTNPVDVLPVSWTWPANTGHNATQLEWTWLEDELAPGYYLPNTTTIDIEKLFRDNATRIDLPYSKNSFDIPLFYDGVGKLYYRIRAVNIKSSGSRTDGQWTVPIAGAGICSYDGHNNALNWQVRSSFAEEGKMKSVMEYFDGSLRSRQTVTKENVNHTTITAETFYDYEGRPAIQILPVPGMNNIIKYQTNLNLFNGQNLDQNPADIFDLEPIVSSNSLTPPLNNNSGAAKYYSTANDELNTGANKYIPDAEGYPYTVTRYMPDGTGRIMAQSGVGAAHKMSSTRETKYYYGTPSREELDALFGTEVGYKSHYFKNMVKDANGQMSVSYVDMHGRTIATALAGDAPANLLGINDPVNYPNQTPATINRDLLDNNTNIEKGNTIESINTILVPAPTAYTFKYKLTPESLDLNDCNNTPICYECLYDLEISITDESGEQAPFVYTYKNLSVSGDVDENCSTHNPFVVVCSGCPVPVNNEITIVKTLAAGSYSVRKTLTLSESSLQKYKDLYQQQGKAICETEQQIIDNLYSILQTTSNCNTTPPASCQDCLTQLGDPTTFRNNLLAAAGNPNPVPPQLDIEIQNAFNSELQKCNNICNTTSPLVSSRRQLMLADMMPYGGQYASETPLDPLVPGSGTSMYDKYNIFSNVSTGQPFYRKPFDANQQLSYYKNSLGEVDLQIHPGGALDFSLLDALSKEDFTNQFVNSWAESLLPHHPEYQRLLFAENTLGPSYNWINSFLNTTTYAAASAAGYITNPTTSDPFYAIAPLAVKQFMEGWINNNYSQNLSLWQIARGQVKCKNDPNPGGCFVNNNDKLPPFDDVTTDEDKDKIWQAFRNLYASARDNQVNEYIATQRPLADDAALINQGYQLRFGKNTDLATQYGWAWYSPTPVTQPPTVPVTGLPASAITQTYTSRCQNYIDQWKQSLLQCGALASKAPALRDQILNEITAGMVAVCIKGSDASNPYGSSTVNPTTPADGLPRSFEEVINQVFANPIYNISKDYFCNPYTIEFPKPYGKNPVFAQELITVVDSCACANFSIISAQAIAANVDPTDFSELNTFLQQQYQETLTPALHEALLNCGQGGQFICNTKAGCDSITVCQEQGGTQFLAAAEPLPQFLKCGFTPRECLTCDKLTTLTNEFKTIFDSPYDGGPVFTGTNLTPEQIDQNNLFARFLNFRMGFQYGWMQYSQALAAATCNEGGSGVVDLEVTSRSGNTPVQYIASNSITFLPGFESGLNDEFETMIQPNGGGSQIIICADSKALNDGEGLFSYDEPCHRMNMLAISMGQNIYQQMLITIQADFEKQYREKCMAAKNIESFTVSYTHKEYHYTLYYYDMAGNLVKTVPPKGVNPNYTTTFLDNVKAARDNCRDNDNCVSPAITPSHSFVTQYRYNSLNAVVTQNSPDANTSKFWYDRLGRLVVSQNAQQLADNKYSYTIYDPLGRIIEVGQKPQTTPMTQMISQDDDELSNWIVNTGNTREQITYTGYDIPFGAGPLYPNGIFYGLGLDQRNIRNRVSFSYTKNLATDGPTPPFYTGTFYTYDIHGNVDTLLQDYSGVPEMQSTGNSQKRIVYNYDLISGKVNMVSYQPDWYNSVTQGWVINNDKFFHIYQYDAENRLIEVKTSRDNIEWERDAVYDYYKYGPLSRTVLGQLQVQGLDYAYTIQGWLKGVNSTTVGDGTYDMGKDGFIGGTNSKVARDIVGFGLHYFDNAATEMDYKAIGGTSAFARPNNGSFVSLFNGNIAAMSVNNAGLLKGPSPMTNAVPLFYKYRYDQLNRIKSMNTFKGLNSSNQWQPVSIFDYAESVSYDPNGNIVTYNRNGSPAIGASQQMDALGYNYYQGNNRLKYVTDDVNFTPNYTEDIDNQNNTNNYTYDAIGNLKTDFAEGITNTNWNVYGKISSITKNGNTINYTYDAAGNRITKTANSKTTIYIRDASGNVMSVYEKPTEGAIEQVENGIYGSSRLGVVNKLTISATATALAAGYGTAYTSTFTRGEKMYELTNHLGNVMATISDRKIAADNPDNGIIDYYNADVITATDYYPFGMKMPGRVYPLPPGTPPPGGGTPSSPAELYFNIFYDPVTYPYTGSTITLSHYLTSNGWTNSQGAWSNPSPSGESGNALAVSSASPTTTTITLSLNVQSGFNTSFTSFSFYYKSNNGGYTAWSMTINGIQVGNGTITPSGGNNMQFTGLMNVANAVNNLTGSVTVVMTLSGGNHASNGSFRFDSFILNGYVQQVQGGGGGTGTTNGYRYGFNGKEEDDEVKGDGNQQDYGMRIYDPRLGKFLSVDPLTQKYPYLTPYQFASNSPISGIDLDGLEFFFYAKTMGNNGLPSLKVSSIYDVKNSIDVKARIVADVSGTMTWYLNGYPIVTLPYNHTLDLEFNASIDYSLLGVRENFVWYKGDYRRVPSIASLPDFDDPIWETFDTWDEYRQDLIAKSNVIIKSVIDGTNYFWALTNLLSSGIAKFGNNGIRQTEKMPDKGFISPTTANTTRGWKVGNPINNLTVKGNVPSWNTVRSRYWKNRANSSKTGEFSDANLKLMKKGKAPKIYDPGTGRIERVELHHTPAQRDGGLFDVIEVLPSQHANIDPYRKTGK